MAKKRQSNIMIPIGIAIIAILIILFIFFLAKAGGFL